MAAVNEAYGRFLERKVAQFGRQHPVVKSEYFNEPLDGKGGLFGERRLALMRGTHPRQRMPGFDYDEFDTSETLIQQSFNFDIPRQASQPARPAARHEALNRRRSGIYVATLDVAGQDEAATDPLAAASQLALSNPGRDYTVGHLFELVPGDEERPEPVYLAVDVFVDRGGRHFQAEAGRPQLAERLLAWLQGWGVAHLVADNSGVGAGLVDWLAARLGRERVTGYTFTRQSKAALGANFLAVVETGRFQYFASEQAGDAADKFFAEAAACQYSLAAGGRFERDLRWGVWREGNGTGHDDRLISAALVAVYDSLVREGQVVLGRAESAVIAPLAGPGDVLGDSW